MDSYVVKAQNKGTIRRLTIARGELEFSYELLRSRIRDLFQLPASAEFELTYIDKDGDVVTMAEDEDLKDALVLQKLNPLRVTIENVQGDTDDVKISSPLVRNESNFDKVTEQQQSIQGEQIPSTHSKSLPVDPVAKAAPVTNSGENSSVPGEKVSTIIDEVLDSNPSDASSPASGRSVDATKDISPEGATTTENKTQEAEGARKEDCSSEVHFGIGCDGCGKTPIAGSRFKSCKKPNYDLCLKCYDASSAEKSEYLKIDRSFYRIGCPAYARRMCRRPDQRMCRKPDQRQDLTPDSAQKKSTAAAAEGRNRSAAAVNSTPALHQGVQCDECGMVPIEGPRFRSSTRFNYDLCHSCFEKSGSNAREYSRINQPFIRRGGHPLVTRQLFRRTSPHRLQDPLNARWVWVLNQMVPILPVDRVGAEEKTPVAVSGQAGAEEKIPAAGSDVKFGGDVVNTPQGESAAPKNTSSASVAKVDVHTTSLASKQEAAKAERKVVQIPVIFNTKETDPVTNSGPETQTPVDVENVSSTGNGTVDNSGKPAGLEQAAAVRAPAAGEGNLSTQEGLLAKLAAMGFQDPKLNAELLEKNNFDLRKTLDDLCAAEEWDPILGELQEMGFYDANLNRRLMFKNNGSVKRVVKELVQMNKGENLV